MQNVRITRHYPECGHSYAWTLEDLQDPDKLCEECPLCRVVLIDPQDDFIVGD